MLGSELLDGHRIVGVHGPGELWPVEHRLAQYTCPDWVFNECSADSSLPAARQATRGTKVDTGGDHHQRVIGNSTCEPLVMGDLSHGKGERQQGDCNIVNPMEAGKLGRPRVAHLTTAAVREGLGQCHARALQGAQKRRTHTL